MGISGVHRARETARLTGRREVYPAAEIPHLWAHGLPPSRKVRNGTGNFYAIGDTIYSYGQHFPIARRVVLPANGANARAGEVVYLLTTGKYSVTTAGHVSVVLASIPDRAGFAWRGDRGGESYPSASNIVAMPPRDSRGRDLWGALADRKSATPVVEWFRDRIDRTARRAVAPRIRAATRARLLERIGEIVGEWRDIHARFGLRVKIDSVSAPADLDALRERVAREDSRARAQQQRAERAAQKRAETEARERAERAELARSTVLPAWRDGGEGVQFIGGEENPRRVSVRDIPYPVLRIIRESGAPVVESSHGAQVTVEDVRRVLAMLPRLLERIGERDGTAEFGHYRGAEATVDALRIGCHTIPWCEVRDFVNHYGAEYGFTLPDLAGVAA